MVKIAIAGGSGQVAREIIDALLSENKHEITILSRSEAPTKDVPSEVRWCVVDYNNHSNLVDNLQGTHTLLSFVQLISDPQGDTQRILVDAAVAAGVKRFAPSEYGSAGIQHMPWWIGKEKTRQYLRTINENEKVIEYTLFQPGLFLDYLAFPHKTAKHIDPLQSVFDYHNCRAIVVEGNEDAIMTLTSAADVAGIIAQAVDYEGKWPEISGISGNRVTFAQVIKLGEKIRGHPFTIDKVKAEDLENGVLNTSWALEKRHKAVTEEQSNNFVKIVSIGILLSSIKGAWDVSNELNKLFPDYRFNAIEDFLTRAWDGKP